MQAKIQNACTGKNDKLSTNENSQYSVNLEGFCV